MKNEINRQLFKEKTQTDSHSIRQVFDIEPQDLAIFHAKANKYLLLKFVKCGLIDKIHAKKQIPLPNRHFSCYFDRRVICFDFT